MQELITLVSQKTGLSEPLAKLAVETVVTYLKGKLPGPVAGQIDGLLGGAGAGAAAGLGDLAKGLGGLFDK